MSNIWRLIGSTAALVLTGAALWTTSQVLAGPPQWNVESVLSGPLPDGGVSEEAVVAAKIPAYLERQVVNYPSHETPGTIIIDTPHTFLYYVLGNSQAIRYGIGVGREGFTWSGVKLVANKTEWPDWYPPPEMLKRQPYLPRMVAGGPGNPLGARAIYIGGTEYRIHGTNDPTTIGKRVSSGCIRLTNESVIDLYSRVKIGAKVIVLPMGQYHMVKVRRISGTLTSPHLVMS